MKICKIGLCTLLFAILLLACATTKGKTPQDKRHAILDMKKETLAELYRVRPQAKSQIAKAADTPSSAMPISMSYSPVSVVGTVL